MAKLKSNVISKFQKIRKIVSDNFIVFSQGTVLHGFRYIGDRSISIWERLFFLIAFVISWAYVITLTSKIYDKWDRTPVIVGLSPYPILINTLPFPTVTICNVNQARASKVRHFSRNSTEYSMLQTLCSRSVDNMDHNEMANIEDRTMFQKFIEESAQPCKDLFVSCKFGSIVKNCEDIFKPVLTDEGQCCAFNSVHPSFIFKEQRQFEGFIQDDGAVAVDWDPEHGYQKHMPKLFYPRVASGTGVSMGLSIVINAEVEDYFCTSTNGPGFKLLLHNPIETPTLRDNGLFVHPGSETAFRIHADRSEASEDIRGSSIDDRQCVFMSERHLSQFKIYTRRNCEVECQANMTAKLCGCISYFLPRTWTNVTTCSLKDMNCQYPILHWTSESKNTIREQSCQDLCMQGCFDLTYVPTKFSIPLTSGGYMIKNPLLEKFNISFLQNNIAVIHFFYKLSNFDGFMRTQYIGTTEFMSNTGGLIGLLGFSFIAVGEVAYYLILRPLRPLEHWILNWFRNRRSLKWEFWKVKLMQRINRKRVKGKQISTKRLGKDKDPKMDHRISYR